MYDFLLSVIQLSTDVTQEPHVYLCEDGLDLWQTTLQCSPSMTPSLLDLYANMPRLLGEIATREHFPISSTQILSHAMFQQVFRLRQGGVGVNPLLVMPSRFCTRLYGVQRSLFSMSKRLILLTPTFCARSQ